MNVKIYPSFREAINDTGRQLVSLGQSVHTERWQGMKVKNKPELEMKELLHHSFSVPMSHPTIQKLQYDIKPNLPWAENHFQERISGQPLNPGEEWKNWPFAKSADRFRTVDDKFTHTYMERYWSSGHTGIRYDYGDLNDVIQQLHHEPDTRQAYLPVWFPEDTGVKHGGRVPCSIGYHFIQRHGFFHVTYQLRSCDFVRHFRDDIYMTVRLAQHIKQQLGNLDSTWNDVSMGYYTQHTTSMHCFVNDVKHIKGGRDE